MKYIALSLVVLGTSGLLIFYLLDNDALTKKTAHQTTLLEQIGDKCVGISENATATVVPIIEFQELELISRKANIVLRCMNDHGFMENPEWVNYAQPIAQHDAIHFNISSDEALENLRRSKMLVFVAAPRQPMFWVRQK